MSPVLASNLQNRLAALAQAVGADIKSINSKLGTVALDPWHTVGAAGAAPFGANWGAYTTCAYRKDPFGKVMLRGVMKNTAAFGFNAANSTLLTLPAGYWPVVDWDFKVIVTEPDGSTTSECQVRVYAANGVVQIIGPVTNTRSGALQSGGIGSFVRLDEIEFDTGTVTQVLAGPQGPAGPQGVPGSSVQVPMDTWHIVGSGGTEPAFQNGWTSTSAGSVLNALRFRKDPLGRVTLAGQVLGGPSNSVVFTLPPGYRPPVNNAGSIIIPITTGSGGSGATGGYVQISPTTGNVVVTNFGAAGTSCYLENVEFDTETVTQFAVGPAGPAGPQGIPGSSVQVPMDPWHLISGAGESTVFQNGWSAYGGIYSLPGFRKYPDGRVRLRGLCSTGASGTPAGPIFTLPVGYRPPKHIRFMAQTSEAAVNFWREVDIQPDGTVTPSGGMAPNNWLALDAIEFDTETVTQFAVGPAGPAGPQGVPGSSVQVPLDPWHSIGGSGEPGFNSGYSNFAGNQAAQYRKDPMGKVLLRGYINTVAAGGVAFTLPAGFRPPGTVRFSTNAQNAAGAQVPALVYVLSDGGVNVHGTNAPIAVDLSTVEFDTDTVTQFAVGPQGPKGDAGGFTGLLQDTDGINFVPYTFRSRLAFLGPNVKLTDGGVADPFGGGDYIGISNDPVKGSGPLPSVNVREGAEYDLVIAAGLVWRMRYTNNKWTIVGGAPQTYSQVGENSAYAAISSGQVVTVNAALTKALQWQYTPLVDVWAEVEFFMGLVAKIDAAYHYIYFSTQCVPQPPIIAFDRIGYRTQHSAVQQYENYTVKARYGLSAGVAYTMNCVAAMSGGSWQFFQGPGQLNMDGKAWPR
jgi:hypothetical protein